MVTFFIILLFVFPRNNGVVADLNMEAELQNPDETPGIKTIQLKGGDVVDCIDFYKQPAFDNPLLIDHKIQTLPRSYIERRKKELEKRPESEVCPFGSVPIPRAKMEDEELLFIPQTLDNKRNYSSSNAARHPHQIFVNMQRAQDVRYRGGSGIVSIYNVSVGNHHVTSENIWIEAGPHYIIAGVIVGLTDKNPRLFTYWSNDGGVKVGCFNFLCKGFIQIDSQIAPGHLIKPVSTYGGTTHDLLIRIYQDKNTGNWILSILEEGIIVGYFPKQLLTFLEDGAIQVAWGGDSRTGNDGITPPMGSGYKPDGQYNHAAYFKKLTYYDENYFTHEASENNTGYHTDGSNCFGFQMGTAHGPSWGYNFLFGGPGGNCG